MKNEYTLVALQNNTKIPVDQQIDELITFFFVLLMFNIAANLLKYGVDKMS